MGKMRGCDVNIHEVFRLWRYIYEVFELHAAQEGDRTSGQQMFYQKPKLEALLLYCEQQKFQFREAHS